MQLIQSLLIESEGSINRCSEAFRLMASEKSISLSKFLNLRSVYLGLLFDLIDCSTIYFQFALVGMLFEK